jgi:hypothetical protein
MLAAFSFAVIARQHRNVDSITKRQIFRIEHPRDTSLILLHHLIPLRHAIVSPYLGVARLCVV